MAPPSATMTEEVTQTKPSNGYNEPDGQPSDVATHEPGLTQGGVKAAMQKFPAPPKFTGMLRRISGADV